MDYQFLKTEVEGYALYAAVAVYFAAIVIVLTRYLKIIRDKNIAPEEKTSKKKKIYLIGFFGMVLCALIHAALFHIFFESIPPETFLDSELRTSYYISIALTFGVFLIVLIFGFYLRGTTTLPKHEGPVTGV